MAPRRSAVPDAMQQRTFAPSALTVMLLVAPLLLVAGSASSEPLYIADRMLGTSLLRVDPATGGRTVVDLDDYPVVMAIRSGVTGPGGEVFLEAINAAQASTIVRYDPESGEVQGVSGYVDRESTAPRGSGPDLEPGLHGMSLGPWGVLYALRRESGPMTIDVVTGDRMIVSQSSAPAVGEGVELGDPLDMVVEGAGSLLVADRFGGIIRVATDDGTRKTALVFPDLLEAAHRIERLADGRLVHAFGAGDGRSITVFDRSLREGKELSGPNRGDGPPFEAIVDLVVAPDGLVYVLDLGLAAVVSVDPVTGDRRVVSDDPERADLGLVSPEARLVSFPVGLGVPAARRAGTRLGFGDDEASR